MKLKKSLIIVVAIVLAIAAAFFKNTNTNADAINDLAKKSDYVGTTFLYQWLKTQNIRYNKFYEQNKSVYRKGKPEGVVIHETADSGASAKDEAIYFNREWNKMYAYVHAFVDHNSVIQMMTPDYGVWGAGPNANDRFIQVELCEENNRNDFAKSVNNDAIWVAQMLHRYKLKPTNATHNGQGTIWSHLAVSKFLGGTDHGDPDGYFAKWGYSMDQFCDLVTYYYDLQEAKQKKPKKEKAVNPEDLIKEIPKVKPGESILMRDAYVYDKSGKRIKSQAMKQAGTVIKIKSSKTIKKTKYYEIGKNKYIVAANVDGTMRTLIHNSYIYDTVGVRVGNTKLLKGNAIKAYGSPVTIRGEKYYAVSATQFVKVDNFK